MTGWILKWEEEKNGLFAYVYKTNTYRGHAVILTEQGEYAQGIYSQQFKSFKDAKNYAKEALRMYDVAIKVGNKFNLT